MEKRPFDDQKTAARFERVKAQVLVHPALFANQGFVAAAWHACPERRFGSHFRVPYRESGGTGSVEL